MSPHDIAIQENYDVLQRCTTINFYVIDYLRAEDVLDEEQEHDLKTERNPLKQRNLLYQWLKNVSSNKYESFLQVMKDTEQEHVANLLKGSTEDDHLPLSNARYRRLVKIRPKMAKVTRIDSEVIAELRSLNAISMTDAEEIRAEEVEFTRVSKLISIIMRRSNDSYNSFNKVLRKTLQLVAANFLVGGEMPEVHVNNNRPDLDGPLSRTFNDVIENRASDDSEIEALLEEMSGLGFNPVNASPGHSIVILMYCKTVDDAVRFTQHFNSGRVQYILESILNRLLLKIEPHNTEKLDSRVSLDEEDIVDLEKFTGIEDWVREDLRRPTALRKICGCDATTQTDEELIKKKTSVAEHFVTPEEVTFGGSKLHAVWPMPDGSRGGKSEKEVICPRTIIVHNISEGHMEHLELILESKRQGGGKLESVCRNPDDSVTATFVDNNVAAEFLERGLVTVFGKAHNVTKPSRTVGRGSGKTSAVQDVSNTIEVSGIPETTSEEFLRMYFENKKRSGGGDIKTMTYDKQEGVATITFSDSSAVLSILEKEEHRIGSEVLQVTALESLTPDLIDQACAVRVSNIPQTISQDFLEVYFESGKRSGGEEFEEFFFDKDAGCAVVVYKSPEVCRRVTGRSHQLESAQLVVEALKPAPPPPIIVGETDEKKLLVGDLPPDFKDEDLKQFLEKPAGCQIIQFHRGPRQDLVLLDFKSIPNYASLRKLVVSRPFRGRMIFVQKVKPSSCILVHSNKSFSYELLMLHFENLKRSGGGEVKSIRRVDTSGDVIIEFLDRKVIPSVLKKKQEIEGQILKTELFHDCLTRSSGSKSRRQKVRIPENITLPVDKRVLKFISDSAKIRTAIESDMQTLNCSIQWQKPKEGTIKLCCTLTPGVKNVENLAAKWEATCSEKMISHLDKIAEIWEEYVK